MFSRRAQVLVICTTAVLYKYKLTNATYVECLQPLVGNQSTLVTRQRNFNLILRKLSGPAGKGLHFPKTLERFHQLSNKAPFQGRILKFLPQTRSNNRCREKIVKENFTSFFLLCFRSGGYGPASYIIVLLSFSTLSLKCTYC